MSDQEQDNTEQKKSTVGRKPIEITKEIIDQAETLAAQGMTQVQIALALGMGESTLYEKMEKYPEFSEAIKSGKAQGIAMVTEKLLEKVMGMDTTSILFYLKCQAGWRDSQDVNVNSSGTNKIEITVNGGPPSIGK